MQHKLYIYCEIIICLLGEREWVIIAKNSQKTRNLMNENARLGLITRINECLIGLGRTHELCLCMDISIVRRTSEIALHKNNECVIQPGQIKHELVLAFIPYYP